MSSATADLVDAALRQIGHRQNNIEENARALSALAESRFAAVHEDRRRDMRDVTTLIDKLGSDIKEALRDRFASFEKRLDEVCDKGGLEHKALQDRDASIEVRLSNLEAQVKSDHDTESGKRQERAQIGNAAEYVLRNIWPILICVSLLLNAAREFVPTISIGPSPAQMQDLRGTF